MNIYDLAMKNNAHQLTKVAQSITDSIGKTREVTYAALFTEVNRFADRLSKAGARAGSRFGQGLVPGDRVALIAENTPEWSIAFLAILKTRCTAVLLDASLLASDLIQQIDKSDVRCILASPRVIRKIADGVHPDMPLLDLSRQGEPHREIATRAPYALHAPQLPTTDGDETIAAIIYSSGTTRTAAGIMHSHEALVESTLMCARSNHLTPEGKYLAVVPNSHIYGLICSILGPLLLGADVRFIELNTPDSIMKAFQEYRPTVFPCVPRVFELFKSAIDKKIASDPKTQRLFNKFFPICLALRQKTGINLGKVLFKSIHHGFGGRIEIFCSAGAPIDEKTAEFYIGTGFNMLITYGATETNIPTLGNFGRNLTTDSCGQPYPDVSVKISETGELLIKSPYMMKGYFRDPELTERAFEDGWFKTGDLCQQNAKGNYVIVGRSKENIVLATGKKVIPDDVERAYAAITGVKELIVCGVPAPGKTVDEIHAFIVRQDQTVNTNDIARDIHQTAIGLPAHMRIMQVHFISEIPRTSLQKPKRFLLKKMAAEEAIQLAGETSRLAAEASLLARETSRLTEKTSDSLDTSHAGAAPESLSAESIAQEIISMIAEVGKIDRSLIPLQAKPFSGLGLDSLNAIELALRMESRFGFRVDRSFTQNTTVAQMADLVRTQAAASPNTANSANTANRSMLDDLAEYPKRKKLSDYRLFRYVCSLARLFYTVKVSNETVIPEDSGYILCANHVTNLDYLWLTINFNRRRFEKFCCMAKQEILNNSHVSKVLAQVTGMIPVDRANVHMESMKACQRQLKERWGLLIHPEGTRSENGELGDFKKGAAVLAIETNVPIIPAYIHGAYDVYPKGSKLPRLFNLKRMKRYAVEVAYGSPIFPQGKSADELIQQVKEAITALKNSYTGSK